MKKKLYQVVVDYINAKINNGALVIGDLIPSESQLSKLLNVSVGTVRKAVDIMENDQLLYRHHGKGTYVSDYGFDNRIFNFFSYGGKSGLPARIYKTTPIREKIKSNEAISQELKIEKNTDVIYLQRLGHINKTHPIIIEKSWWLAETVEGLQDEDLHIPDLLYALILEHFKVHIKGSKEVLTAGIADQETAEILNIGKGDPIMILNRHSYTANKDLVEFRITIGRADMFSYTTTIGDIE